MNTTLYLVLFWTCIVTHLQTEVLRRVPLFGKMSESHIFIVPLSKRCAIIVILLDRKIILSKLISLQNSTDDDPIKIIRINNISFNIDTFETYYKIILFARKNRLCFDRFEPQTFQFITDRSRVDAVLNILPHVLISKESKRARAFISGRADGWKLLQLESPWNNPIFRVYHCSFLRSDPTSKWMHNDISHLLVEMERFYSLENAIFPWKGKEGGRGRKGDTRHIQRGNTLTNAFDNVSGEGVVGGREDDCV